MIVEEFYLLLVAATVAANCALIGSLLLLRKMVLLGDALSHAMLPGIVVAFAITGSLESAGVLLGASIFGLLAVALIERLAHTRLLEQDAAIGVVFTGLFALGVLGVSYYRSVDLDLDCILFGNIELTPFDLVHWGGLTLGPRAFWVNAATLAGNALLTTLLFKELKVSAFDPEFAHAQGLRPRLLHYLVMIAAAMTCVAAFSSVGAILVVAMLAVPPAAAYLWSRSMARMVVWSVLLGAAIGLVGYPVAYAINCSVAGAIALVSGICLVFAITLAPDRGLLARWWAWRQARLRTHALLLLTHLPSRPPGVALTELRQRLGLSERVFEAAVRYVQQHGLAERHHGRLIATEAAGRELADLPLDPSAQRADEREQAQR